MEPRRIVAKELGDEGGYVLVGALLILVLLTLLGLSATTSTNLEIQVAASDRTHKETFYTADGGTEIGAELVEQSIWDFPTVTLPTQTLPNNDIVSVSGNLYLPTNYQQLYLKPVVATSVVAASLTTRDAYFNYDTVVVNGVLVPNLDPTGTRVPRTDIQIGSRSVPNAGGAMQQLAGYEGKGKGAPGSGIARMYQIDSISFGTNNSQSWLTAEWRHLE